MKTVERGAALLDEQLGSEWDEKIDLKQLSLGSCRFCILGHPECAALDGAAEADVSVGLEPSRTYVPMTSLVS